MPGCDTGKFLSEALIFASTNPQYDDSLFIELWVQYMKIASSEHDQNRFSHARGVIMVFVIRVRLFIIAVCYNKNWAGLIHFLQL